MPEARDPAAHLAKHRWPKGVSGNPGGRPRGTSIKKVLARLLAQRHNGRSYYQLLGDLIYREAMKGKAAFVREILDRVEGPVGQKAEVQGSASVIGMVIAVPSPEEIGHAAHQRLVEKARAKAPPGGLVVVGESWLEL